MFDRATHQSSPVHPGQHPHSRVNYKPSVRTAVDCRLHFVTSLPLAPSREAPVSRHLAPLHQRCVSARSHNPAVL